jgi:hypothetical protein
VAHVEKTVFINYRRTAFPWAQSIHSDLTQHGFDVFIDSKNIASGGFENIIFESIKARAHFLVLLTPSALNRCENPEDLFRREIECALENKRNIVPLMLEGFDFGGDQVRSQLVNSLAPLKDYNGFLFIWSTSMQQWTASEVNT